MIIKIAEPVIRLEPLNQSPGQTASIPDGIRWCIFGDIEEVEWHDQMVPQAEIQGDDQRPPTYNVDRWFVHPDGGEGLFWVVSFTTQVGKRVVVAFNTVAWLCNNQGDTVEKIGDAKRANWGAQSRAKPALTHMQEAL